MTRRAMITGISGFVGPYLAAHLLESGDAVLGCSPDGGWLDPPPRWPVPVDTIVETNSTGRCHARDCVSMPNLRCAPGGHGTRPTDRVEMVGWDIGLDAPPPDAARCAIEQFAPDAIYHLAALSVPADCGEFEPSPAAMMVNVLGTRRLLELAASLVSHPRVLLISTSHVYAPVSTQSSRVDETFPLEPRTGYARSKFLAEEELRRAICQLGCEGVIARSFNHTGPGQTPRLMVPQWARQLVADGSQPIEIYTRDASVDMTDVRDVVRAYRLLMERGESGATYNVGCGISRRSGDILDLLCTIAGQPDRPIRELRPGLRQCPIADNTRLVRATGWSPVIPFEKTLGDTLEWWRGRSG